MTAHWPVMCQEIVRLLSSQPGKPHFVDATFGRGGHTKSLLDAIPECRITAIDRDPEAIAYGNTLVLDYGDRLRMIQSRFSCINQWIEPGSVAGIFFDFGVSSPQLDQGERGFSFMNDGPLDMRMECSGESAADLVNYMGEEDLANLIFKYGEERASRRIAKAIVQARKQSPLTRTNQLSALIEKVTPRRGKQHPATKTFQALRIAVNQEMDEIEAVLPMAARVLQPGGCMVVMAFHSLEDRPVKHFFKDSIQFSEKTKKPIRPTAEEVRSNPRSRSACLRYGVKSS